MRPDAQTINVTVLVSVGRHPITGRPRRADQDARGVEMALTLPRARVFLLHAGPGGDDSEVALRAYVGMGLDGLSRVEQPQGADVLPTLARRLAATPPQLVITGACAERGEGSGLLPYALAEWLGWPVVNGVVGLESIDDGVATLLQALPRGQRRRLRVRLPAIFSVDGAAPSARQSAFGPSQRARLDVEVATAVMDEAAAEWTCSPARKRPKRLKIVKAASAQARFKAAVAKDEGSAGQVLTDVPPEQGAEAIFRLLEDEGVLR